MMVLIGPSLIFTHGVNFVLQGSGHEGPDGLLRWLLFIEDTIDLFHNGHFHAQLLGQKICGCGGFDTFSHHLHVGQDVGQFLT